MESHSAAAHRDERERLRVLFYSRTHSKGSNTIAACGVPPQKGGTASDIGVYNAGCDFLMALLRVLSHC